ncbi:hypothetical protein T06_13920 [Trichinella sp. T6]|nr:hypothetical protein T06_13920 [Trichinella sp. T6]
MKLNNFVYKLLQFYCSGLLCGYILYVNLFLLFFSDKYN